MEQVSTNSSEKLTVYGNHITTDLVFLYVQMWMTLKQITLNEINFDLELLF